MLATKRLASSFKQRPDATHLRRVLLVTGSLAINRRPRLHCAIPTGVLGERTRHLLNTITAAKNTKTSRMNQVGPSSVPVGARPIRRLRLESVRNGR